MAHETAETDAHAEGARIELTPDSIHEADDGQYIDCPACGAAVDLVRVIETGRCTGALDADDTETVDHDQQLRNADCTAHLSLELYWEE